MLVCCFIFGHKSLSKRCGHIRRTIRVRVASLLAARKKNLRAHRQLALDFRFFNRLRRRSGKDEESRENLLFKYMPFGIWAFVNPFNLNEIYQMES